MIPRGYTFAVLGLLASSIAGYVMGAILAALGRIATVTLGLLLLAAGALIEHFFPPAFLYLLAAGAAGLLCVLAACLWTVLVIIAHAFDLPDDDMSLPQGGE